MSRLIVNKSGMCRYITGQDFPERWSHVTRSLRDFPKVIKDEGAASLSLTITGDGNQEKGDLQG
jgi:hypothetical protein